MKESFKKGFGAILGIYCGMVFTSFIAGMFNPKTEKHEEKMNNPITDDTESKEEWKA